MAALDDLKEQLKERGSALWERINESTIYNNIRERYEAWPPALQKGLIVTGIFLIVAMVFSLPFNYLESASDRMTEFEERRSLIRELLKAGRVNRSLMPISSGPSPEVLRSQIDGIIRSANLIPDQIGPIQEADANEAEALVPKTVGISAVVVSLKKLNLRQVVDIGYELNRMHSAVKLLGLEVSAANLKNYYDAQFKVVSFSFPGVKSSGGGMGMGGVPPIAPADEYEGDEGQ